ncbi:hypothetical protein BGZ50_001253 [Haplosporangium sp. Z 11]|nr:hypothetical protein BGZ50_001253 [Haplosporangium sp. Z 11]
MSHLSIIIIVIIIKVQLSIASIETTPRLGSVESYSSSSDQDIANKGIVPDTLFTFVHPLPHVVATSKRQLPVAGNNSHQRVDVPDQFVSTASTTTVSPASSTHSTPSPHPCQEDIDTTRSHQHVNCPKESKLEAAVNRLFFSGLPPSLNSSNVAVASSARASLSRPKTTWRKSGVKAIVTEVEEEGEQENLTRLKLPASTPLYTTFLKRLESQPWFSNLPSNAEEDSNIRNPTSFSAGNTALRGKSAAVDNSNNNSGNTKSKRRSWSTLFTFRNRRSSLPAQPVSSENHRDRLLTVVEKNHTFSVFSGANPQETDEIPAPHDSRQKDQYSHQFRRLHPIRSVRISAPASERKTAMLATQEQSLPPTMASSPTHGRNFSTASRLLDHGKVGSIRGENRNRHSLVYDQNKPLPTIMSEQRLSATMSHPQPHSQPKSTLLMSKEPQQQQATEQPSKQSKKQRRMSFLPSALKTSNLAKFVSGNGSSNSNNSPTPRPDPTISPRSTRSPIVSSPRPIDQGEEEQPQMESGLLAIDQFKWATIACCNEIKSRVAKQRSALNMASNPELAAKAYTQQQQREMTPATVPQRKAEKNKASRFNSNAAPMDTIETTNKDPSSIVQALLQVMMLSSSTAESTSMLGGANGASDGSSINTSDSVPSFHHSPSAQSQNKSLLSLMGISSLGGSSTGTGTTTPKRTKSITQLSHFSSFHSLVPSLIPAPSSSASINPPPSSYSRHQHPQHHNSQHHFSHSSQPHTASQQYQSAYSQQQQHAQYQHPRMLRSKKSQTKLAIVQATDAILNPLLLQDLVNLLAYTLSLAPDQWIPWHLYDFFVRPQGMKFKDLIELLPTQSQRILRAILETVDALVDYSVMVVVQHHNMQQQQRQSFLTSPPTASMSATGNGTGGDAVTGISPFIRGPLRQQLSQVHMRGKIEANTGINNGSGPRSNNGSQYRTESIAMALAVLDPPLSESFNNTLSSSGLPGNGDDTILQEVTLRARRRRAILDGLSGLVFRPRQDQDAIGSNLYVSEQQSGMTMGTDERSKGKRRGSIVIGGIGSKQQQYPFATPPSSAMTAAMMSNSSVRLQQSEREREAGYKAFENLVYAFEEEYHPRKPTTTISAVYTAGVSVHPLEMVGPLDDVPSNPSASDTGILAHERSNPAMTLTFPRDNTLPTMRNKAPPRQSRSLPLNILPYVTSTANPNTDDSAVRSLSLPPWRKNSSSSTVNLVHSSSLSMRPDLQPRRSHHSITESHLERPPNRRSTTAAAILSRKRASYSGPTTAISAFLTTAVTTEKKEITRASLFAAGTTITSPRSVEVSSNTTAKNQTKSEPSAFASVPSLPLQNSAAPSSAFVRGRSCTIGVVNSSSDSDRKSARLSARLSATWTSWKDHLLVLEEEEYVIVDTSDSEEEKDKEKKKKKEDQHHGTEDVNGESSADDPVPESGPTMATKEPEEGNIMVRKKSGTFGNLEMFAAVVEANAKRLEREQQERWRRQKQRKQQRQQEQQRSEVEEKDDEEK